MGYFAMRREGGVPELDGLRAIAILLVLGRHAVRPFWSEHQPLLPLGGWDVATVLINGWIGVDLFFVLSGFLITLHLCGRYRSGSTFAFKDYLWRRALRILPVYYTMLLIVAVGLVPGYTIAPDWLGLRLAYHALFLQDYLPPNIVVVFWSLGVEEKFYLLAPLLLLCLWRLPWQLMIAVTLVLVAVAPVLRLLTHFANPEIASYELYFRIFRAPFHVSFDGLTVGMLCGLLYRIRSTPGPGLAHTVFWLGLLPVVWLLAAEPLLDRIELFDKVLLQTVLAISMGGIVLGTAWGGGPAAWLRRHSLFFLARISYSLYVVHLPLIPGTRLILENTVGLGILPPAAQLGIFLPAYGLVAVAAALVLYYVVEKPFLMLRDGRLAPKLHPAAVAGCSAARIA